MGVVLKQGTYAARGPVGPFPRAPPQGVRVVVHNSQARMSGQCELRYTTVKHACEASAYAALCRAWLVNQRKLGHDSLTFP